MGENLYNSIMIIIFLLLIFHKENIFTIQIAYHDFSFSINNYYRLQFLPFFLFIFFILFP